jgi:hypothetical protein
MKKYFITDGAPCICKFGTAPGMLKVNSHRLMVINHADKKIATSQELQNTFYPPAFGSCTFYSPFIRPCSPVVIQWSDFYKKMRIQGNAYPLMPESKATCAVCGAPCIDITFHGQIEIPGPLHIKNATTEHQTDLDPAGSLSQEENAIITAQLIEL